MSHENISKCHFFPLFCYLWCKQVVYQELFSGAFFLQQNNKQKTAVLSLWDCVKTATVSYWSDYWKQNSCVGANSKYVVLFPVFDSMSG